MDIIKKCRELAGVSLIDTIYKTLTFRDFLIKAFPFFQVLKINRLHSQQAKLIDKLHEKNRFKVLFLLQNPSVWKYDALYKSFVQSGLFEPIVVITPFNVHLIYDKEECFRVMRMTEDFAKSMGYHYVSAYDWERKRWQNIKQQLHPDIVFFTKPYKDTLPQYHLYNFLDCLTLYVPYGIGCIDLYRTDYNLPFMNLLWRYLLPTDYHRAMAQKRSLCKGENVEVVGALGMEMLMREDYVPIDVWKTQMTKKKRIIWAPHHTVDYLFNFSNFLVYCDEMLMLADKYDTQVQFAFKPHPVLKFKLINLWGKERTEEYYSKWENLSNGQLEEGNYLDLFFTSDAMIHDCASFTAEYMFTRKPALFMVRDSEVESHWNPFGRKCFDNHYHASSIQQIEDFIKNVVIRGQDTMSEQRENFYRECLYPKDGIMPSQKIFNLLCNTLKKNESTDHK